MRKNLSHVMLKLHNMRIEPLNVRKKSPSITSYLLMGTVPSFFGGTIELPIYVISIK